jgi:hypothetical protein
VATRTDVEALRFGEVGFYDFSLIGCIADSAEDQSRNYCPPLSCVQVSDRFLPSPSSLAAAIRTLQPDMVHSLELQHGAYLCLEARRRMEDSFPIWMASNWGSDVFLFRKLPSHSLALREVMQGLDALHSECARDNVFAAELGFKGIGFPNVPASGGSDPQLLAETAVITAPSQRKLLLIKGYHGWAGRGQHLLLALHKIAPMLKKYRIRVTHGDAAMIDMVRAIAAEDGLDIAVDQYYPDHKTALARLMQARAVVGCGISDGISTTVLEAMMVGTFPVQSDTACACEWFESGIGGIIVPPHNTGAFAEAIARALTDDRLVDDAAVVNREVVMKRWNTDKVGPIIVQAYQDVFDGVQTRFA